MPHAPPTSFSLIRSAWWYLEISRIMKLPTVQLSPFSRNYIPLRSEYSFTFATCRNSNNDQRIRCRYCRWYLCCFRRHSSSVFVTNTHSLLPQSHTGQLWLSKTVAERRNGRIWRYNYCWQSHLPKNTLYYHSITQHDAVFILLRELIKLLQAPELKHFSREGATVIRTITFFEFAAWG
jgi:hypothetical protein